MALTNNDVQVMGYEDPALEGESIAFTCLFGLELSGSSSSTCMGDGEWEPDPREVNCTGDYASMLSQFVHCRAYQAAYLKHHLVAVLGLLISNSYSTNVLHVGSSTKITTGNTATMPGCMPNGISTCSESRPSNGK